LLAQFRFDFAALVCDCCGNLRALFLRKFRRVKTDAFRSEIYRKEKQDAGEQIQSKGIHVADALSGEKLIC
jgi:hypothetical protein